MNTHRHILIFDPVPYANGSKQVTHQVLELINQKDHKITVLTANKSVWQDIPNADLVNLRVPNWLNQSQSKMGHWLIQYYFCIMLFVTRLLHGRIDSAVAAAAPSIDIPLYLMHWLFRYEIIQLIHAPVGWSRAIGYCLTHADRVFYPPIARSSMLEAIACQWEKMPNSLAHQQARLEMKRDKYTPFDRDVRAHVRLISAFSHCQQLDSLIKH